MIDTQAARQAVAEAFEETRPKVGVPGDNGSIFFSNPDDERVYQTWCEAKDAADRALVHLEDTEPKPEVEAPHGTDHRSVQGQPALESASQR